jgi:hypothetical protein
MKRITLELVIETEYDDWVIDWIHQHKDEIIKLKMNNKKIEEHLPSKKEIERLMEWFDCMEVYIDKHPENAELNAVLKHLPHTKKGKDVASALLRASNIDVLIMGSAWPRKYGGNLPPIHKGSEEE